MEAGAHSAFLQCLRGVRGQNDEVGWRGSAMGTKMGRRVWCWPHNVVERHNPFCGVYQAADTQTEWQRRG